MIPERMRAMVLTGYGGLEKLEYREDWPLPVLQSDEVLIEVRACGMNNTDINTRIGWYSKSVTEGTTAERGTVSFSADYSRIIMDLHNGEIHEVDNQTFRPVKALYMWPLGAALILAMLLWLGRLLGSGVR